MGLWLGELSVVSVSTGVVMVSELGAVQPTSANNMIVASAVRPIALIHRGTLGGKSRFPCCPLVFEVANRTGLPERPDHKHRLEEQSVESGLVSIKPEGADALNVLVDVSQKDCDEERCCCKASPGNQCSGRGNANPKHDLHYTGSKNHEIRIEGQPDWHLSLKLCAREREVADACVDESPTKK